MVSPKVISPEFLLWCQSLLLWSIAVYGVMADPLHGEAVYLPRTRWMLFLSSRAILAAALTYALCHSIVLSGLLLLTIMTQPLLRYCLPMRLLAEFESVFLAAFMVCGLTVVRYLHISTRWVPASMSSAQLSALCILASTLVMVVRGGTYIVRGILRKSSTLPSKKSLSASVADEISIAASDDPGQVVVDLEEYNRGRLIGNLERIVLTIVVAAGSYAALAFLVAAKGVVRSDEFDKNRDFAEYFLIGSLSSVLVALCAGILLRFALIRLWPDLLSIQIQ